MISNFFQQARFAFHCCFFNLLSTVLPWLYYGECRSVSELTERKNAKHLSGTIPV